MQKTSDEIKRGLEYYFNLAECNKHLHCGECHNNVYTLGEMCDDVPIKDALARIKQLETQVPRWIPVEERLPECADEDVLVIVNGEHGITTFYDAYMLARYCPGVGWFIDGYEDWETPDVSFWLPLPEPPEGKPPIGGNSDDFVHGNHG